MAVSNSSNNLKKVPTGIAGLDEITYGGLPYGRPTLVMGYAGSGKTVFAMQFILNGIKYHNEPGVFVSLEESENDLVNNISSFGYDIKQMQEDGMLVIENIPIRQSALFKSGDFDLTPIFIRIEDAVKKIGARRIAIDTFELIFNEIRDKNVLRQELMRLISWLKEKELTSIFTSESYSSSKQQTGIEEFVTDCVITLKHQVIENIYTRRLHILKYRGSMHGTNEYPFLISAQGISLLPITTTETHDVSSDVISTGIPSLDENIDKKGLYKGSCTLISGVAGTGKTSFSVSLGIKALTQNERCLFFIFEESKLQLERNMKSMGFDLESFEQKGLLKIVSTRPTLFGLETHLLTIYKEIGEFKPDVVLFDPITDMMQVSSKNEVRGMILRIIDFLKSKMITIIFTALVNSENQQKVLAISSLVDNWISLRMIENGQDIHPGIRLLKIRGMKHSRVEYVLDISEKGLAIKNLETLNNQPYQ